MALDRSGCFFWHHCFHHVIKQLLYVQCGQLCKSARGILISPTQRANGISLGK